MPTSVGNRGRGPRRSRAARAVRGLFGAALALSIALVAAGCELPKQVEQRQSILALFTGQTPSPADALRMAQDAHNPDNRYRGLTLISNAPWGGAPEYVRLYEQRVGDEKEDPSVRAAAARALGMHGDPDHVPKILPLLDSDSPYERIEAVRALQRLHNPVAVEGLLNRLKPDVEDHPDIRAEAADALGQYAQRRVLQGLIAALDDESFAVTSRALKSLRTLTGQTLDDDRRTWVAWLDGSDQPFAGQTAYVYPVFHRDPGLLDMLPFTPPVPNEIASNPVGMPQVTKTP